MTIFLQYMSVFLMSGFKYLFGNLMAIAYGLAFVPGLITAISGGLLGVTVYIFFGEALKLVWFRLFPKQRNKSMSLNRKKWIIRAKKRGGLFGIALLTPPLFMVPGGTFIALVLGFKKNEILLAMGVSFALWSFVLQGLYLLFGIEVQELWATATEAWI